jgi:polyphosphate kinase 2 (PPK2 family)
MTEPTTDNIYPVGMRIRAWVKPEQELVIHKYYQRIYYCAIVAEPERDHLVYFERELMQSVTKEKIL